MRGRICLLLLARTTTSVFSRITRSPAYVLPLEVIHLFANAKARAYTNNEQKNMDDISMRQ